MLIQNLGDSSTGDPDPASAAEDIENNDDSINVPESEDDNDEDDKELTLQTFAMPPNIRVLENIINTTQTWMDMIRQRRNIIIRKADLTELGEDVTNLLYILDDAKRHNMNNEVKRLRLECMIMKTKWEKLLEKLKHGRQELSELQEHREGLQEYQDHEEQQETVDVENNVATKKQRLNDPE